jgi:hypothetical protein
MKELDSKGWGLSSNHVKSAVKDVEIAVPVEPS